MTQISATAPVTTFTKPIAAQPAPVETPRVEAPRETADMAPIALAANGISRVVMDAASAYDCGTKVETTREVTAGRDFDRLAYVLEGFEHMRRVMQPAAEAQQAQQTPEASPELFAAMDMAQGAAMDMTV